MKVTFLFGAGASRNALPIVSEIPERLKKFIAEMKNSDYVLSPDKFDGLETEKNKHQLQLNLIEDLEWVLDLSTKHASIDTAAKKLYIRSEWKMLTKLKVALSCFFVYEQLLNKADYRYDAFFASLLTDSISRFPDNIRVVSWNYDYQFELSFQQFSDDKRISSSKSYLNVVSKFDYDKRNGNGFKICKLNGTTGLAQSPGFYEFMYLDEFDTKFNKEVVEKFVRNYAAAVYYSNKFYPTLSFAWERQNAEKDIVEYTKSEVSDTEILVVIGYSFPFFNREVDKNIIGSMSNLKKVYFQSPDADQLINRFESITDDTSKLRLKPINDTYQFFLPHEL